MTKGDAIQLLGGTPAAAARLIGVTYQAVDKWPELLPRRISDRVLGVCARERIEIPRRFVEPDSGQSIAYQGQAATETVAGAA